MNVSRTTDVEKINRVLKDPAIFDRISEDGISIKTWQPDIKEAFYLTDDKNIGVMIYHWINQITLECHVQVLPQFRKLAHEFGQKALRWAWVNTEATKIVAQIPSIYPDVVRFAYKHDFKFEGTNRQSYKKHGKIYDQYYLGLVRPEGA